MLENSTVTDATSRASLKYSIYNVCYKKVIDSMNGLNFG